MEIKPYRESEIKSYEVDYKKMRQKYQDIGLNKIISDSSLSSEKKSLARGVLRSARECCMPLNGKNVTRIINHLIQGATH